MKLSHVFRTTILASTLAFGLTGYVQASNEKLTEKDAVEIIRHRVNFSVGQEAFELGDYATALEIWRPLAEQGNTFAQFGLGVMYHDGLGVAQDYQQTAYWWQKAARQGQVESQYQLGVMYRDIFEDYQQAVYWYQKAAQQGYASAKVNLGVHYLVGAGVKKDIKKARSLWQQACKQGEKKACENLEKYKLSKKAK
ncbi:sel1 repeat family protein [Ursidibacter maritimus]|uniref:tetratricopeptide repeat protein n=1 Tax=Ursidibacter maritimus TaxID=1331689 RepID=UPI001C47D249|nr:tetratricopeptide repeat protein [Ursidibacter maritimus]MBV6541067.1 sel1 repeat family protein [Ursidibacter maritimus]